jgi:hypothetical protein
MSTGTAAFCSAGRERRELGRERTNAPGPAGPAPVKGQRLSGDSGPIGPTRLESCLCDEYSAVCQKKFARHIDKVTSMVSNSPYQRCVLYHLSPSHSSVALQSSACYPVSSNLIDGHFRGSKQAHHGTGKRFIKGGRCMFTFCTIARTDR